MKSPLFFAVLLFSAMPALAQGKATVKQANGAPYICTGIGESKDDPRLSSYPLKIVFATNKGELYADVTVKISKIVGGDEVFNAFCDGAWLLVKLPPDGYKVTAVDSSGVTRICEIGVPSNSQASCTLRWPD